MLIAVIALLAVGQGAPQPAPAVFRSIDKNLTFPAPSNATYCPLPAGWVGSDHGTTVFLVSPASCGGAGYASSNRSAANAPRIHVYYGYDAADEEVRSPPDPCEEIGRVVVLGHDRPLCITRDGGHAEVRVETPYMAEGYEADIDSDVVFTLMTSSDRLTRDLESFRMLMARAGTCNRTDGEGGSRYPNPRPDCLPEAVFF